LASFSSAQLGGARSSSAVGWRARQHHPVRCCQTCSTAAGAALLPRAPFSQEHLAIVHLSDVASPTRWASWPLMHPRSWARARGRTRIFAFFRRGKITAIRLNAVAVGHGDAGIFRRDRWRQWRYGLAQLFHTPVTNLIKRRCCCVARSYAALGMEQGLVGLCIRHCKPTSWGSCRSGLACKFRSGRRSCNSGRYT
jgi:hypothetical protein